MGIYLKILAFSVLMVGALALQPADKACAQGTPGGGGEIAQQTCDTQVWRAMTTRARIETEREIMQNQNLIYKPDSILAYTCFDSMAAHIGAQAGVLFTHTSYWTPMPIAWGSDYAMDTAVDNAIISAIGTYFEANFNHSMLGGRGNSPPLNLPNHTADVDADQNSTYQCNMMARVWQTAKCLNFLHTAAFTRTDGFYPFINIMGLTNGNARVDGYQTVNETRRYPENMSCESGANPIPGSSWLTAYRNSRNESSFGSPNILYVYGTYLDIAFRDVRRRIAPYGSAIGPAPAGPAGSATATTASCSAPIRTGVSIILSPGATATYSDAVCTNPGCTYTRGNGGTGTCSTIPAGPAAGGGGGGPQVPGGSP